MEMQRIPAYYSPRVHKQWARLVIAAFATILAWHRLSRACQLSANRRSGIARTTTCHLSAPVDPDLRSPEPAPKRLVVDAQNISLTFETADGRVDALSNVSLQVAEGEFVSFIGPSGCGKTTMLRVIADLQQPSSGTPARQRHERGERAAGAQLRLRVPGAGAVSVAHHREEPEAAAGDHGLFGSRAAAAGRALSLAGQSDRLRAQISLAALGRHAAAGLDRARALVRSRRCC